MRIMSGLTELAEKITTSRIHVHSGVRVFLIHRPGISAGH